MTSRRLSDGRGGLVHAAAAVALLLATIAGIACWGVFIATFRPSAIPVFQPSGAALVQRSGPNVTIVTRDGQRLNTTVIVCDGRPDGTPVQGVLYSPSPPGHLDAAASVEYPSITNIAAWRRDFPAMTASLGVNTLRLTRFDFTSPRTGLLLMTHIRDSGLRVLLPYTVPSTADLLDAGTRERLLTDWRTAVRHSHRLSPLLGYIVDRGDPISALRASTHRADALKWPTEELRQRQREGFATLLREMRDVQRAVEAMESEQEEEEGGGRRRPAQQRNLFGVSANALSPQGGEASPQLLEAVVAAGSVDFYTLDAVGNDGNSVVGELQRQLAGIVSAAAAAGTMAAAGSGGTVPPVIIGSVGISALPIAAVRGNSSSNETRPSSTSANEEEQDDQAQAQGLQRVFAWLASDAVAARVVAPSGAVVAEWSDEWWRGTGIADADTAGAAICPSWRADEHSPCAAATTTASSSTRKGGGTGGGRTDRVALGWLGITSMDLEHPGCVSPRASSWDVLHRVWVNRSSNVSSPSRNMTHRSHTRRLCADAGFHGLGLALLDVAAAVLILTVAVAAVRWCAARHREKDAGDCGRNAATGQRSLAILPDTDADRDDTGSVSGRAALENTTGLIEQRVAAAFAVYCPPGAPSDADGGGTSETGAGTTGLVGRRRCYFEAAHERLSRQLMNRLLATLGCDRPLSSVPCSDAAVERAAVFLWHRHFEGVRRYAQGHAEPLVAPPSSAVDALNDLALLFIVRAWAGPVQTAGDAVAEAYLFARYVWRLCSTSHVSVFQQQLHRGLLEVFQAHIVHVESDSAYTFDSCNTSANVYRDAAVNRGFVKLASLRDESHTPFLQTFLSDVSLDATYTCDPPAPPRRYGAFVDAACPDSELALQVSGHHTSTRVFDFDDDDPDEAGHDTIAGRHQRSAACDVLLVCPRSDIDGLGAIAASVRAQAVGYTVSRTPEAAAITPFAKLFYRWRAAVMGAGKEASARGTARAPTRPGILCSVANVTWAVRLAIWATLYARLQLNNGAHAWCFETFARMLSKADTSWGVVSALLHLHATGYTDRELSPRAWANLGCFGTLLAFLVVLTQTSLMSFAPPFTVYVGVAFTAATAEELYILIWPAPPFAKVTDFRAFTIPHVNAGSRGVQVAFAGAATAFAYTRTLVAGSMWSNSIFATHDALMNDASGLVLLAIAPIVAALLETGLRMLVCAYSRTSVEPIWKSAVELSFWSLWLRICVIATGIAMQLAEEILRLKPEINCHWTLPAFTGAQAVGCDLPSIACRWLGLLVLFAAAACVLVALALFVFEALAALYAEAAANLVQGTVAIRTWSDVRSRFKPVMIDAYRRLVVDASSAADPIHPRRRGRHVTQQRQRAASTMSAAANQQHADRAVAASSHTHVRRMHYWESMLKALRSDDCFLLTEPEVARLNASASSDHPDSCDVSEPPVSPDAAARLIRFLARIDGAIKNPNVGRGACAGLQCVVGMPALSIIIPLREGDTVVYSEQELTRTRGPDDGAPMVSQLELLVATHRRSWAVFAEAMAERDPTWCGDDLDTAARRADDLGGVLYDSFVAGTGLSEALRFEVRWWASLTGSTLARTLHGACEWRSALGCRLEVEQQQSGTFASSANLHTALSAKLQIIVAVDAEVSLFGAASLSPGSTTAEAADSLSSDLTWCLRKLPWIEIVSKSQEHHELTRHRVSLKAYVSNRRAPGPTRAQDLEIPAATAQFPCRSRSCEVRPYTVLIGQYFAFGEVLHVVSPGTALHFEDALFLPNTLADHFGVPSVRTAADIAELTNRTTLLLGTPMRCSTSRLHSTSSLVGDLSGQLLEARRHVLQRCLAWPLGGYVATGDAEFVDGFWTANHGLYRLTRTVDCAGGNYASLPMHGLGQSDRIRFSDLVSVGAPADAAATTFPAVQSHAAHDAAARARESGSFGLYRVTRFTNGFRRLAFFHVSAGSAIAHVAHMLSLKLVVFGLALLVVSSPQHVIASRCYSLAIAVMGAQFAAMMQPLYVMQLLRQNGLVGGVASWLLYLPQRFWLDVCHKQFFAAAYLDGLVARAKADAWLFGSATSGVSRVPLRQTFANLARSNLDDGLVTLLASAVVCLYAPSVPGAVATCSFALVAVAAWYTAPSVFGIAPSFTEFQRDVGLVTAWLGAQCPLSRRVREVGPEESLGLARAQAQRSLRLVNSIAVDVARVRQQIRRRIAQSNRLPAPPTERNATTQRRPSQQLEAAFNARFLLDGRDAPDTQRRLLRHLHHRLIGLSREAEALARGHSDKNPDDIETAVRHYADVVQDVDVVLGRCTDAFEQATVRCRGTASAARLVPRAQPQAAPSITTAAEGAESLFARTLIPAESFIALCWRERMASWGVIPTARGPRRRMGAGTVVGAAARATLRWGPWVMMALPLANAVGGVLFGLTLVAAAATKGAHRLFSHTRTSDGVYVVAIWSLYFPVAIIYALLSDAAAAPVLWTMIAGFAGLLSVAEFGVTVAAYLSSGIIFGDRRSTAVVPAEWFRLPSKAANRVSAELARQDGEYQDLRLLSEQLWVLSRDPLHTLMIVAAFAELALLLLGQTFALLLGELMTAGNYSSDVAEAWSRVQRASSVGGGGHSAAPPPSTEAARRGAVAAGSASETPPLGAWLSPRVGHTKALPSPPDQRRRRRGGSGGGPPLPAALEEPLEERRHRDRAPSKRLLDDAQSAAVDWLPDPAPLAPSRGMQQQHKHREPSQRRSTPRFETGGDSRSNSWRRHPGTGPAAAAAAEEGEELHARVSNTSWAGWQAVDVDSIAAPLLLPTSHT